MLFVLCLSFTLLCLSYVYFLSYFFYFWSDATFTALAFLQQMLPFSSCFCARSPLTLLEPPFPQGNSPSVMNGDIIKKRKKEGNKRVYVFGGVIENSPLFIRRVSLFCNQWKGECWKWLVGNFISSSEPWRCSWFLFLVVFQVNLLNHFFPAKINLEKSRPSFTGKSLI